MGFLNKIRNIGNIFGTGKGLSADTGARKLDFFVWTGNSCSIGFELDLDSIEGITSAYNKCSILSTIINRNALSMANCKWWIVDDKDNDVSDKYPALKVLMKQPNPLQSWSEFVMQMDVIRQLYGEVFVYSATPTGFDKSESSALWVINPQYVDIELTGKLYSQSKLDDIVKGYFFNIDGKRTHVESYNILHIKDSYQNISISPSDIRGQSRLSGLRNAIRNVIQAEEAIYSLNKDRGAQGILSNKTSDISGHLPLSDEEKEKLYQELGRYGIGEGYRKIIIANQDLNWQSMSFSVKDLMLFEGIESNVRRIAEAFGYPSELLNNQQGTTFNNKQVSIPYYYRQTIIPIAKMYGESFTKFFELDGCNIVTDFSDVEELKKSENEKSESEHKINQAMKIAYENGIVSKAEWRLRLGMDEEIYKPENTNNNEQGNKTTGKESDE